MSLFPVARRLRHPTLLGDDVIRLVELIEYPLRDLLFKPFSQHTAPLFHFISWITWQLIGHNVTLAPLGFSIAAVTPWLLVLGLLTFWLRRETRSPSATLVAVALVAGSPLALETAWWYSASSFAWAIAGILTAVLGASCVQKRPRGSLVSVLAGSALAPAATTLGLLAAPLAVLRGALEPEVPLWPKLKLALSALAGTVIYLLACTLGGGDDVLSWAWHKHAEQYDPLSGLVYTFSVPGRVLWPSVLGVPASWTAAPMPAVLSLALGFLALAATAALVLWPRPAWNRRLVLLGTAFIYLGYTITYVPRASMLTYGLWTEAQLLYDYAGRYHVLPLLGLSAVVAALVGKSALARRFDGRRGLPAIAGTVAGLLLLFLQRHEADRWAWMLSQPDQKRTLAVLKRVGEVARREGITRAQLLRIIDPPFRPWNGSLLRDRPDAFHLLKLAIGAPRQVRQPLPDDEARRRLLLRLSPIERVALGSGSCVSLNPASVPPNAQTVAVAQRVGMFVAEEVRPGRYQGEQGGGFIEFEFDSPEDSRFLLLPGLQADQDVLVTRSDAGGRWPAGRTVRFLRTAGSQTAGVIDLARLVHWPDGPISRIRIEFTRRGEIALAEPPRLLR